MKVKEPIASEYSLLREGQLLFTYLHLAAEEALTHALVEQKVTAIAYETVQLADGSLPLLTPMSEVAGRMAVQIGAHYLEKTHGGRGQLLGGVPGVRPSNVVIVGGGVVGTNAAQVALGMGAQVTILEKSAERMRYLSEVLHGNLVTVMSNRQNMAHAVSYADLLIGAVLIPGAKAPRIVSESMVRAIAQLARAMNITTVAEYVETEEIRTRIRALGVDYGQGFAIARPIPLAEVLEVLPVLAAATPGAFLADDGAQQAG